MRFIRNILLVLVMSSGTSQAERLQDWLSIPPAFEAMYGNPRVIWKPKPEGSWLVKKLPASGYTDGRRFFNTPKNGEIVVKVPASASRAEQRSALARVVADEFFRRVLSRGALAGKDRRLKMTELIEMDREIFLHIATARLQGQRVESAIQNTWWNVRMGLPLATDERQHLVIINLHFDYHGEKTTVGHFCFALRKKGGDANGDILFDFRAPWHEDRAPRFTEGINIHNRLKLAATTVNLYDWLYTQTEYRHCYVNLWFVPVAKEQVALLRYFEKNEESRDAGNFRAFRKNCASLGAEFLDRLNSLTEPQPGLGFWADFPVVAGERFVESFGSSHFYCLTNVTDEIGREPTAKSKIHPAQPSRGASRPFALLREAERKF